MTRTRYRIFETEYPYFLTGTVVAWLPIFSNPAMSKIIFDSWRFLQQQRQVKIFGYVLMENHLHRIAAHDELSERLGQFKSFTARQIIDALDVAGNKTLLEQLSYFKLKHKVDQDRQLWQEGSHPQQIQNPETMRQKLEYIHYNPVRRGYVDDPVHWRYSSARNYAGHGGIAGRGEGLGVRRFRERKRLEAGDAEAEPPR
jgi:putative transposase